MTVQALPGFRHFPTHHCVTGSMRHVYAHAGCDVSEELLLGLGAGVSFSYWHLKGQLPFMGGRGGFRPPLEETTGSRTGVTVERHTTSSRRKARQALVQALEAGQPVMLGCDMGFLPYFDFGGQEYHFGGHSVVACGWDAESDQVLIADRDEDLHAVPMSALGQARGSTYKPFPPENLWFDFGFQGFHPPTADDVALAVDEMVRAMLEPPIRNVGVAGIRKAAGEVPRWPALLGPEELRAALLNAYIFISAEGGTGGGCFRHMLSRFLREAGEITGDARLDASAAEFWAIGDRWEELAEWFRQTSGAPEAASRLGECTGPLRSLADLEEAAWRRLGQHRRASRQNPSVDAS
jgi:hypothetical protein